MKDYRYLIIGGGVAGTTAAQTLRQKDSEGTLCIVGEEPYRFYSRLMLSKPNFFLGKVPFESIWLKKPEWYKDNRIDFSPGMSALEIDPKNKAVKLSNGESLGYEKLLLALGSKANRWPSPDSQKQGVYYLRTLDDAKAIMETVKSAKKAVVIGGGFVGFEMCEMLRLAGIETTLLIREKYFWDFLWDEASGHMLEAALERTGVKIFSLAAIKDFLGSEKFEGVELQDGEKIYSDMAIIGIGVNYPVSWLQSSGIKINKGIITNEYLETNIQDIWAAGDVTDYYDRILEEQVSLGNWVNAQEQGRVAALNMLGQKQPFNFVSFYTTQGMGVSVAFVGDIRPLADREVIYRGSEQENFYSRILLKNKKIIGATMINRTAELGIISKLIEKRVDISDKIMLLSDSAFDIRQLVV